MSLLNPILVGFRWTVFFSSPSDSNKTHADRRREIKHTFSAHVILYNLGPTSPIKRARGASNLLHNEAKSMICPTGLWRGLNPGFTCD